jgi:hypothetical protein
MNSKEPEKGTQPQHAQKYFEVGGKITMHMLDHCRVFFPHSYFIIVTNYKGWIIVETMGPSND